MRLTDQQLDRYLHHIALKDVGGEGQRRLLASRVLVIGAGGLGSPAALYLAAAGVGTVGICDDDRVELSNLQRQILHATPDLGRKKVESAREKLAAINPDVKTETHAVRFTAENAARLFANYDFVIDATDNFTSKYAINDACVAAGMSFSHGGVVAFKGQTFTHVPGGFCLRCLFPEPPPEGTILHCRGEGILGPVAGIVGAIQATEALKYLLGRGELLSDRLLTVDALTMEFRSVPIEKNAQCPVCRLS